MAEIYRLNTWEDCPSLSGASVAFGVFDGVHAGHRYLISQTIAAAGEGSQSAVLTFDIDPDELFRADGFKKLQSNDERIEMLASLNVDRVVVLPFTREFASKEPELFLQETFGKGVPAHIHVGHDLRFGHAGSGTVDDMRAFGERCGMHVHAFDLLCIEGAPVTSTRIRSLLAQGDVQGAVRLLERPYGLAGVVREGRGDGAKLGFPTANLVIDKRLMVLTEGVYGGYAYAEGRRYRAAISVGVSRTFASSSIANVEAHLLDYSGTLYGTRVYLEFLERLRPMQAFADVEQLIDAVRENIEWVRDNIDEHGSGVREVSRGRD